ncbi:unknown [Eubacterium sp. CAG:192]|nr:unknown [Eubacterium sp. CAG:192]
MNKTKTAYNYKMRKTYCCVRSYIGNAKARMCS